MLRLEVPLDQVRGRSCLLPSHGGADPAAATDALPAGSLHEAGHALAADADPFGQQLGVNPGHSIGAAGAFMDEPDTGQPWLIGLLSRRRRTLAPGIEAARGDTQQPAHQCNGILGLSRPHELEPVSGIAPVSRANQAAAVAKISRSSLS